MKNILPCQQFQAMKALFYMPHLMDLSCGCMVGAKDLAGLSQVSQIDRAQALQVVTSALNPTDT